LKTAITNIELEHLLDFIGYGRLDAEIWFLGMQEEDTRQESTRPRLKFRQIEDLAAAINLSGNPAHISEESNTWLTWHSICHIMLRLHGKNLGKEDISKYQADFLGRENGTTLLCYIMPLSAPDDENWPYQTMIPQYSSGQAYYKAIKPRRLDLFKELLNENHPKTIVAYGREHWGDFKEIFDDFKFAENGSFEAGWNADTVVILADHFTDPTMHDRLNELTTIILENSLSIETPLSTSTGLLSDAEEKRRKKEAARQASAAKRKPSAKHNPADPYCVCEFCLGYEAAGQVVIK
jgi:hypothetical protein